MRELFFTFRATERSNLREVNAANASRKQPARVNNLIASQTIQLAVRTNIASMMILRFVYKNRVLQQIIFLAKFFGGATGETIHNEGQPRWSLQMRSNRNAEPAYLHHDAKSYDARYKACWRSTLWKRQLEPNDGEKNNETSWTNMWAHVRNTCVNFESLQFELQQGESAVSDSVETLQKIFRSYTRIRVLFRWLNASWKILLRPKASEFALWSILSRSAPSPSSNLRHLLTNSFLFRFKWTHFIRRSHIRHQHCLLCSN